MSPAAHIPFSVQSILQKKFSWRTLTLRFLWLLPMEFSKKNPFNLLRKWVWHDSAKRSRPQFALQFGSENSCPIVCASARDVRYEVTKFYFSFISFQTHRFRAKHGSFAHGPVPTRPRSRNDAGPFTSICRQLSAGCLVKMGLCRNVFVFCGQSLCLLWYDLLFL